MHCRTKSAAEIIGYMNDASAAPSKRPNNALAQLKGPGQAPGGMSCGLSHPCGAEACGVEALDHSHAHPTVWCNEGCFDAVMEPGNQMWHSHDHTAALAAQTASAAMWSHNSG